MKHLGLYFLIGITVTQFFSGLSAATEPASLAVPDGTRYLVNVSSDDHGSYALVNEVEGGMQQLISIKWENGIPVEIVVVDGWLSEKAEASLATGRVSKDGSEVRHLVRTSRERGGSIAWQAEAQEVTKVLFADLKKTRPHMSAAVHIIEKCAGGDRDVEIVADKADRPLLSAIESLVSQAHINNWRTGSYEVPAEVKEAAAKALKEPEQS